jgi:uroporphyrinogen-III synthase
MRVLVTRPDADAEPLVEALQGLGFQVLSEPLLAVEPIVAARIDLDGVQALLFTSANGVRAFAELSPERGLPVFAVGDATARAAEGAGFTRTESAGGTVEDLAALAVGRLDPAAGALFHGAASQVAGDLKGLLEAAGFAVRRAVLYRTRPAERLSSRTRQAIAQGGLDAVLFFSPRTADTFVRLSADAGLSSAFASCHAVCLSQAVATRLEALTWRDVHLAARPDQDHLLRALQAVRAGHREGARQAMADSEASKADPPADPRGIPAQPIIAAFGGVRPMAAKLGVPVSTVQGWKARGVIPAGRHHEVRAAAEAHDLTLPEPDPGATSDQPKPKATSDQTPPKATSHQTMPEPEATSDETGPEADPSDGSEATPAIDLPRPPGLALDWVAGTERGSWLIGAAAGAIVVVVALIGALLGRAFWPPPDPAATLGPELAQLGAELAAATTRLEALEGRPAPAAVDLAPLEAKLEQLAGEVRAARSSLDGLDAQSRELAAAGRRSTEQAETLERRSGRLTQSLEGLGADQAKLAARLERLEAGAAVPAATAADLSALSATAEELGRRLGEADGRLAALESLEQQVRELRAARQSDQAGIVADYYSLKAAIDGAGAYRVQLDVLRARLESRQDLLEILEPLQERADGGIADLSDLRSAFGETARQVVVASAGDPEGGVMSEVMRRLAQVVTVRPTGEVAGQEPSAFVARAEALLEAGDLSGAIGELNQLEGEPKTQVDPWLEKAKARVDADAALAALAAQLIARPTANGG